MPNQGGDLFFGDGGLNCLLLWLLVVVLCLSQHRAFAIPAGMPFTKTHVALQSN
jgi:hypothetical protein